MATKKKIAQEERFFIVQRDSLSMYGNENGSDRAEAERLLEESAHDTCDLVVIRGKMISPRFNLE